MKPPRTTLAALAILILPFASARGEEEVRTWTSSDGKTLEAEFVKGSETELTIRRSSDGRQFTLPLERVSETDRAYVKARLEEAARPEEIRKGPYFEKFTGEYEKMVFEDELPFQVFAAKKLKATEKYPLVVYLHGMGQRGGDNEKQLGNDVRNFTKDDFYNKRECVLVVPQCAAENTWNKEPGENVIALVKDMLEKAPVDKDRVYLVGYSMGGYGTWTLLAREPELFAAGVPVAGGASPKLAEDLKDVPIWAFHGEKDPTVKVEQSRQIVEALKEVEGKIKYTEYEDADHAITGKVFSDEAMHEWLFAQKRGT